MAGQDLEELMLMEAMRLSLLDHEEHQRKEAEEKKKQEAAATATAAAAAGMIQGSDGPAGPGPSTLEGRQSLLDTSSSLSSASSISRSASPSIPTHTKVGSQDSLTPNKRSWSISRSRTPPPPSSSAGPSALNSSPAALLASTTPSNGHERWARSITPEPDNRNPASFQPSGGRRVSLDNSMPTITLSNDRTITTRISDENHSTKPSVPFSGLNLLDQETPSTSQTTTNTTTSTTNELGSGALSHGYLSLSRPHLPSLNFEDNDDSSKSHLVNSQC